MLTNVDEAFRLDGDGPEDPGCRLREGLPAPARSLQLLAALGGRRSAKASRPANLPASRNGSSYTSEPALKAVYDFKRPFPKHVDPLLYSVFTPEKLVLFEGAVQDILSSHGRTRRTVHRISGTAATPNLPHG
jgi:hypothetical protein